MEALVTFVKTWRARMVEVIRPILGRGSVAGDSAQRMRRKTERY